MNSAEKTEGRLPNLGIVSQFVATLLGVFLAVAVQAPLAMAKPGDLDLSFGENGLVETRTGQVAPNWSDSAIRPKWDGTKIDLATAANGSIVARGNLVLRYLPNGQLDKAFGKAGRLTISSVEGLSFGLADVAIDSEGRILAFGTAVDQSITREVPGYSPIRVNPSYAVVMRFGATGDLDPSFGNGDGVFRDGMGLSPLTAATSGIPLVTIESAEIDSQGRAVMAIGEIGFPPHVGHSYYGWVTDTLARLTPSGKFDPSFGGGDGVVEDIVARGWIYEDFCISNLDEPVISSREFVFSESELDQPAVGALTRLRTDGSTDPTFGEGTAYLRGGSGPVACDQFGRVIMLQRPGFQLSGEWTPWKIVRVSADGRVDHDFGQKARAIVKLPEKATDLVSPVVDRRGRVLLAGTAERRPRMTATRLLASGKPDRRFGNYGYVRVGLGRRATLTASEAALDQSGHLLIATAGHSPQLQPGGIFLARYLLGR